MRLKFTSPHVQDKSAQYNYASSRSLLGGVARVMKLGRGGGGVNERRRPESKRDWERCYPKKFSITRVSDRFQLLVCNDLSSLLCEPFLN